MRLRAWQVGVAGAVLALAFVSARWAVAADGDISRFVVAGQTFVDPAARRPSDGHLHVFPSAGYDGQFYWRLAVDPTEWGRDRHHGVAFDSAYRAPRIGYPTVAHLAAGGRADLVVWSLVAVNVAAVGVVAHAAARLAGGAGRDPLGGLAVAAAPGLVLALGRDLTECVTVAGLVGGIAALAARRPLLATGAWTLAVLSREQALLLVGAYAAWRLAVRAGLGTRWPWVPRPTAATAGAALAGPEPGSQDPAGATLGGPGGPGSSAGAGAPARTAPGWADDLPWLLPAVAFAAWQAVLWRATGELPLAAAGGTNLVPPFTALVPGLVDWARGDLGRIHAVAPLQLAVAVALVVAAARAAGTVPARLRYTAVALAAATIAGTCLAASIWRDPSDLRHLVDVSVLSWVVLLTGTRPIPRWAGWATGVVWLATAGARIAAI